MSKRVSRVQQENVGHGEDTRAAQSACNSPADLLYSVMRSAVARPLSERVHFSWILSARKDLLFYIGSALAGWLYVGIIYYAIRTLDDPLHQPLGMLKLGGIHVPLTLEVLVVLSWALILDAPHVWATLGRTLFDPDEWRVRGREIRFSFIWFLVGPAAILLPYLVGDVTARFGLPLPEATLALGGIFFFVFFRLWAYYHVVRQHWGFFTLYKRKADERGALTYQVDRWFFNLSLYMPLVLFLTSTFYEETPGFPPLGMRTPIVGGVSLGAVLHPLAWTAFLGVILFYLGFQLKLWRDGQVLNGSKLLYMALIVPLHFVAFSHPILAVFVVPLVTVGHNIQYHCIVYSFAQNKYRPKTAAAYRWVKLLFKNFAVYALVGLLFTFAFYRGPWIDWLKAATGLKLDVVLLNSIGMMAGIRDPAKLALGERIFAAFLLGWAMQHYYLDSKIWRVSKDKDVQRNLNV
ncbi:MAG: hypothetical protein D6743_09685 [Calditrichaeota bacterium]|nr:MAG: hypothetical protein D6743_09685 [Calditrichota bacterium]